MTDERTGPEEIGTVAEEAAKLMNALSGWARDHGAGAGHQVSDLARGAAETARNVNEHLATGAPECTYCPICRTVHLVRQCTPEVRAHLTVAATNLLQAAAALMATQIPSERRGGSAPSVEHIDLDDSSATDDDWGTGAWPGDWTEDPDAGRFDGPFGGSADQAMTTPNAGEGPEQ